MIQSANDEAPDVGPLQDFQFFDANLRQSIRSRRIHCNDRSLSIESVAKECSPAARNQIAVSILDSLRIDVGAKPNLTWRMAFEEKPKLNRLSCECCEAMRSVPPRGMGEGSNP